MMSQIKDETGELRLRRLRRVVCEVGVLEKERHIVWKLFLGVGKLNATAYAELLSRGASSAHEMIRSDAGRTFRSDARFCKAVGPDQIVRVLNALRHHKNETSAAITGANRCPVCATLLFAMPSELEAFWTLDALASRHCPTYFSKDLHGARAGAALVFQCLKLVDPEVAALVDPDQFEQCCAFPLLASFFSCAPPLCEVVVVWDIAFAVGVHFFVVLCLALCVSMRSRLLAASSNGEAPLALLQPRKLPPLDAKSLGCLALDLAPSIPEPLFELVRAHPLKPIHRCDILDCAHSCL